MEIKQKSIESLIAYDRNTKKHLNKQIQQVAASIKEFGFAQPIVVDKNDVIIVGHGRLLAAKYLGMETVPVLTLDLTEEQVKAYRLADNKLNESDWDMKLVIQELKELSMPMIDLTGFSRDLVIETEDKDDLVPAVPNKAKSQEGDLYQLGRHKLICGDSTKPETYAKLMGEIKADMVFTDPPYNVNYKGRGENTKEGIMNDKMGKDEFGIFLEKVFNTIRQNIKGGGWTVYIPFDLHSGAI